MNNLLRWTFGLPLLVGLASAQLTAVGPFTGQRSESFESYPNGNLADGTVILNGTARLNGGFSMSVYQPGTAEWSLGTSGNAQVSHGTKGLGLGDSTDLNFNIQGSSANEFGGYFGARTSSPTEVFLVFLDTTGNLIGETSFVYDRSAQGDGLLEWHGWSSTVPIGLIQIHGDDVAMDHLQVDIVPEPASLAAMGAGLAILARRRRAAN